jgi:hypothetical protein
VAFAVAAAIVIVAAKSKRDKSCTEVGDRVREAVAYDSRGA